jgi:ribosomal peptide maturation radical SAM protein 1
MDQVKPREFPRVALIQMPFAITSWPSLGLSLLKSALREHGIESKVFYFNSLFSSLIGDDAYSKISLGSPQNSDLLGEWIFSGQVWANSEQSDHRYVTEILFGGDPWHRKPVPQQDLNAIKEMADRCRSLVGEFLKTCVETVDWNRYAVVGFTSVFQQHLASLALARLLKAAHPNLKIVFGGANCEGEMGRATLQNFSFIDAVCTGEGDTVFPRFIENLASGVDVPLPGIVTRSSSPLRNGTTQPSIMPPLVELDELPYPDFDEFFDQTPASASRTLPLRLLFETSRGCWWGQKNHCTFCGLNGQSMKFRQKSADRAIAEIEYLIKRYGHRTSLLSATDNIIPHRYFKDFLPRIAEMGMELDIFYETKANLKKDQLQLYRCAGLREIQPGIESLQSDVLRRMQKGVSSLQNIQLLKWCKEFGIIAHWNYLYGFPGEQPESYARASQLVPRLVHLTPPVAMARLRFDRFSPYVSRPESFAITDMRPYPAYHHIYPGLDAAQTDRVAYYFVGNFEGDAAIHDYTAALKAEVDRWKRKSESFALAHVIGDGFTILFDARHDSAVEALMLRDQYDAVYRECDSITTIDRLARLLYGRSYSDSQIEAAALALVDLGILEREDDQYLALSIPLGASYGPPPAALARLQHLFANQTEGGSEEGVISIDRSNLRVLSLAPN